MKRERICIEVMRFSARLRSKGFSLMEVMVALAIMSVSVVAVFQLYSLALRSVKKADDYTSAGPVCQIDDGRGLRPPGPF